MCLFPSVFIYNQLTISLKIIFILIILKINADDNLLQNHVLGRKSLDPTRFLLYIDENGSRFVEVPYQYMKQSLRNQKMWRTWSIVLIILCFIFFCILIAFLIHNFRTSTGPFSLCTRRIDENISEDKLTSSDISVYPQTGNIPTFNQIHQLSSFQNNGQL